MSQETPVKEVPMKGIPIKAVPYTQAISVKNPVRSTSSYPDWRPKYADISVAREWTVIP